MFVKETKVGAAGASTCTCSSCEGQRDERGRVRHKVVANLGRRDPLKASGQLDALALAELSTRSGRGRRSSLSARDRDFREKRAACSTCTNALAAGELHLVD